MTEHTPGLTGSVVPSVVAPDREMLVDPGMAVRVYADPHPVTTGLAGSTTSRSNGRLSVQLTSVNGNTLGLKTFIVNREVCDG